MDSAARKIEAIDAPGVKAEGQLLWNLRKEVAALMKRSQTNFPGAQPVSFTRRHIDELRQKDYYVCEKSDGIRYLLYLTADESGRECHYLIDRKNDFWYLNHRNLHFPLPNDIEAFHTHTLVDGELVMDDLGGGVMEPKFLVFDCIVLDNKPLMERTLDKRLGYFKENVFKPYSALFEQFPEEARYMAFKVEMKEMQFSYGIEMMFRQVLPTLKHGNDGLIFTCRDSEYRPGTDPHILKWKPVTENTVDFRLRLHFPLVQPDEDDAAEGVTAPYVDYDSVPQAELWAFYGDGGGGEPYRYFAELFLSEEDWEAMKACGDPLVNRVVECAMDEQGRWRIHRFRDDKLEANHISVVSSVMDSIRDGVGERELLDAAKSIKDSWKSRQAQQQRR
ncbi:uncharacterized protein E0L32_005731 [Thyridium curvatum]|uniref:mRNA-capping enzyme subunit alpha n=1 Tax=Thyridium curvatum TaxID=1093900 RepID=A0A507B238_9PEZI|nr:uncharacterized protein E0L32_005731 [Thyridium curvatum]TPX13787.1 hypothetical protein E0L32_005731 [Thyridium curvatum]